MRVPLPFVLCALTLLLCGCASTTSVTTTGITLKAPICSVEQPTVRSVVYWQSQWRADQKEPAKREAAALAGIRDLLDRTECLEVTGLHRLPDAAGSFDQDLLHRAAEDSPNAERVLVIVVRELGPRLEIGLPVLLKGETEVHLELRVLDPLRSASLADAEVRWNHGGPFVVKGVKTLPADMSAALRILLRPPPM